VLCLLGSLFPETRLYPVELRQTHLRRLALTDGLFHSKSVVSRLKCFRERSDLLLFDHDFGKRQVRRFCAVESLTHAHNTQKMGDDSNNLAHGTTVAYLQMMLGKM
jgi:hypothetical protein